MAGTFPDDLRYTESDEWIRRDGDELVCGITSFASDQLGDVVYIQLPEAGRHYDRGDSFGEIESVKAVSDLYCPLAGSVAASNDELDQNPGLVNEDPYGRGWIVRLKPDDPGDYDELLDAAAYEQSTAERG
ncbi:MAG: glycine cleavage system protein GcvH [Chloroflexi bacterium]|nr:glycine cleavage system protein GcvH [Chloroflexota bacterium]